MDSPRPTPLPSRVDVLIAGAGPAGSALAWQLAREGIDVLAVDRAIFPRDKACSEYMSPETVRLLDRIGVVPALEAAGAHPLRGTTVVASEGARLSGEFARLRTPPWRATGLSVPRRILDQQLVLAARAAGADIAEGVAVAALLEEKGGVAGAVLRQSDGGVHEVRARLTVGADGLRSVVARRGSRRTLGAPSRIGFVAHVAGVSDLGPSAGMHVGSEGYLGLNPIGGGVATWRWSCPRGSCRRGERPADAVLQRLERCPAGSGEA